MYREIVRSVKRLPVLDLKTDTPLAKVDSKGPGELEILKDSTSTA